MQILKKYYEEKPLQSILLAALLIRLLAVVFSKGFGWIDDQFLIIEIAQSWVDGTDYYNWLPNADGTNEPKGFSFFYVGFHYLLFSTLEWLHITDPQSKMYIVRLIHALWSLLIVYFGYKITLQLSNKQSANLVGWLFAVLWFFPFLSVRNLVEFVSIPFLLWGLYLLIQEPKKNSLAVYFFAGILFGLAFNIRIQSLLFAGGVGLVLLSERKWKESFLLALGLVLSIVIIQGGIDYLVWNEPFVQLKAYVLFNVAHSGDFTSGPWYVYLLFLLGILVPPVSLFLFFGCLKTWRKLLILFVPIALFLVFHSYFPNKQERFIITIVPFLIIAGIIGWNEFILQRNSNKKLLQINKYSWYFFWTVNLIMILPVTLIYSKKARVESMTYLSQYTDIKYFIIEDVNKNVLRFPPIFYLEKWVPYDALMQNQGFSDFSKMKNWKIRTNQPDFVLFFQPDNIELRVDEMRKLFPNLEFETLIKPGKADKVLHWLNPINDNQNIYIYRNEAVMSELSNEDNLQ